MIVKNLNKTGDRKCPCGSWIEHWKLHGGPVKNCSVIGCTEPATDGGHIQKKNSNDFHWYIVPLCKGHNGLHGQGIDIYKDTLLIPATTMSTCGRNKKS